MSSEFNTPHGLPLLVAGLGAGSIDFSAGEAFWKDARRIASEGTLGEYLDEAISGHSAPRTWLFLHEPGEWTLATAAAMAMAHTLAERDQSVVIIDGDGETCALSQQVGAEERAGWIDMARYGSGLLECGIDLPFQGRKGYLLPVGSYVPAEPTEAETDDLLRRLHRQADDVLICAPATAAGRRWAGRADLRLLCWDRADRASGLVEELAANFAGAELPLTGLVGYGLPAVDEAAEIHPEDTDALVEEVVTEDPKAAAAILDELEIQDQETAADEEFARSEEEFARRKSNSGLFVWAAVVFVALIAVSGFYYLKYLRVPSEGHFPPLAEDQGTSNQPAGQVVVAEIDSGITDRHEDLESPAGSDAGGSDEIQPVTSPPLEDDSVQEPTPEPAPPVSREAQPQESDSPDPEPAKPAGREFDMGPYLSPTGEAGWALHVYSFSDSASAVAMQKTLGAKGYQSAVRGVLLEEKGRWYRVYLGSFAGRQEAFEAKGLLLPRLGEDWARIVRFR